MTLTMRDPLGIYDIANTMLECASASLLDHELELPDRRCVISGGIAWDDCECGQLTVAIDRYFPSEMFPQEVIETGAMLPSGICGPPLIVVDYAITMLRCAPDGGEGPEPPTCEELDEAAKETVHDAFAVRQGVFCCLRDLLKQKPSPITHYLLRSVTFVGPQGMCQGSELRAFVGLNNVCPCPDDS
jgi:hypothetical protein